MHIKPIITRNDIKLVKEICNKQKDNPIYKERLRVNLKQAPLNLRKEALWKYIVTCLLTTQQRSGENSHIYKFLKNGFAPLRLLQIEQQKNKQLYIESQLKTAGGIRRLKRIAEEAETILLYLNESNWELLRTINAASQRKRNRSEERALANSIVENKEFKGLGPKQARNLLQMVGYSIYEIPIDSRITYWINENHLLPFKLGSQSLSDNAFYCFLNDLLIELCNKSGVKPCLFDAAVFSRQMGSS